jgi:hypothetical protein
LSRNYELIDIENSDSCYVKINQKEPYTVNDLSSNMSSCSCYEQQSLNLPCRHIFFAKKTKDLELFNSDMVPSRHRKLVELLQHNSNLTNIVVDIPNINSIESLTGGKKLSNKEMYNNSFRICQELCTLISKNPDTFNHHMTELFKLKQFVTNDTEYQISAISDQDQTLKNDTNALTNLEKIDEELEEEAICSSQHSTKSTSSVSSRRSSIDDFDITKTRLIKAPIIGAPKKKQKAAALLTNNLSAYSQTANNDHLTTKAISSFKSTTNSSKITKNEQRWLDLLKCIVVTDSRAKLNNITKLKLNEEDILEPCLSNMKFLSPEAFYNYQQFIKTTSLNYYDKETEEKINEFLDLYKITNSCSKCKKKLKLPEKIKICKNCYEIFHTSCVNIDSTKQWCCNLCS